LGLNAIQKHLAIIDKTR